MLKNILSLLFALVALATAQSDPDLPQCSLGCFPPAIAKTKCAPTDYYCQCTGNDAKVINDAVTVCLATSGCSQQDLMKVKQWGDGFCPGVLATASALAKSASMTATAQSAAKTASTTATSEASATQTTNAADSAIAGLGWRGIVLPVAGLVWTGL